MTAIIVGIYLVSVVGAVGILLLAPRQKPLLPGLGALLAAAALGSIWLVLWRLLGDSQVWHRPDAPTPQLVYYYLFSLIALASAVRVITHQKPVYAALWFVMTVLASAGLLLVSGAEFVAFAMIIIYGGAILVTYLFVIMLASQSTEVDGVESGTEEYDRVAKEPAVAVTAGFLLLAVLLTMIFAEPVDRNPDARMRSDALVVTEVLTDRPSEKLAIELAEEGNVDSRLAREITGANEVTNSERLGLELFEAHPLGLELAGVVLLISLIGAVVMARQRIED